MSTIDRLLDSIAVPRMLKVRQTFERPVITDVIGELHARLLAKNVLAKIRPGQKIAITCGSRGISNLPEMVRHFKKGEAFVVTTKKLTFAL